MTVCRAHEIELRRMVRALEKKGWRALSLRQKSPDGIGTKDGKIAAIEVLQNTTAERLRMQVKEKRREYSMFDEVFFSLHYGGDSRKGKKLYNLYLSKSDLHNLEKLAVTEDRSVGWLVRHAIKLYLEQPGGT